MQTYIPQPPSLKGDERAQLEQMYRYLYKMSEQLNSALAVTDREYQIVVQTKSGSAPGSESPISPQLDAQYRELRSLIIKTADIVNQQMDKTIKQLNGKFEAISSEWGTFEQNIERKIVETAEATIDSFDYSEKIHGIEKTVLNGVTSYAIESLGYIKRGIIGFDDENFPIYGIAVGTELKEKTVEKDGKTYQQIDTTKRIATYTSDAITFWRNDVAIARFSGDELYVTRAEITQQIRLGDWFFSVSESGGLNISKRLGSAIDISENGTITSLVGDIDEANTSISQTRNDITALAKRTSEAEGKISSTESKLELKADSATLNVVQETVDGLSGRVSTAESKLELKADSATLTVMETNLKQYTNSAVDNISVGGRNLLLNSGVEKSSSDYLVGYYKPSSPLVAGEEYTVSLQVTPAEGVTTLRLYFSKGYFVAANFTVTGKVKQIISKTFTMGYYSGHTPDDNIGNANAEIYRMPNDGTVTGATTIHWIKIEKGNKATDWSPAPEDIEERVSAAELKIQPDAIVSTVRTSEGYKADQTALESKISQSASDITLSVKQQINGIAVGGRNYILESGEYDPITGNGGAAQDYYIFKIADAFWSNDERIDSNIVFSFDWEWNTGLPGAMNSLIGFRTSPYYNASFQFPAGQKTGHVSLSINIPTLNYTATHLFVRLVNVSTSYNLAIRNAKLEVGNKATDWSPAPEDPAGSLSVNSDYSKVDINTERVRIVSKRMEVAVPSEDGEDDVLRVDADGVHAEVVEADMIVSESVVHTQGAASYTPANAGELAAILTELSGKHLTGRVYIDCKNVTSGNYTVANLSGEGIVTLTNGTMNQLKIDSCGSTTVYVLKVKFSSAGTALLLENSSALFISGCTINASVGIAMGDGWPTKAIVYNCGGDCSVMARVNWASELRVQGSGKPTGTISLTNGAEVYNATPDPTFTAKASPSIPTTQTATVSLSPTSTSTSGYGSKLYQGRYSSSQSLRKGVMLFTLPSDLTSADKIDSATLTLKRIGGVGQGGGVSVHVRCYDVPGTLYASKTAYDGQTVSIDVTSAVKAMKTSGYTGLMLYNPDTTTAGSKSYTASYARFAGKGESGAPVLKISYRK